MSCMLDVAHHRSLLKPRPCANAVASQQTQQETTVKETDQAGSHFRKDSLLTPGLGSSVAATGAFGVELLCDSLGHRGGLHVGTAGAHRACLKASLATHVKYQLLSFQGVVDCPSSQRSQPNSPLMNIASQLFKRATFPLGGNNVFVQNLLRKLSTCCFFRMSLCLQPMKRPVFTMEPAGISSGAALSAGTISPSFLGGETMSLCQSHR